MSTDKRRCNRRGRRSHKGRGSNAVVALKPWRQRVSDALFAPAPPQPTKYWAYFWPLLFAAFVLRAFIALWGDFVLHPDEIMQYLEPAHYLVFGNGILYWEYLYGMRSWLIPGTVAGVLKALDAAGLAQPAIYIAVVKLLFCLLSLLVPWAMYRLTQITVNERAARLALIFGCFWYELAALAHKPFTEFTSAALLLTALALSVGVQGEQNKIEHNGRLFTIGLLAALAGAVRMQYAPLALLLLLLRSMHLRPPQLASLWAGAGLLTVLVGVLEWLTWGAPFHSYLTNFFVNIALRADRIGESSRWLLIGQLTVASGGGALIAFAATVRSWRRCRLILLISAVTLILHLLPEHREYRFIYLLIPCWLILLAAWISQLGKISAAARHALVFAVLAFGIQALLNVFPWQSWVYKSFSKEKAVYYLRNRDPVFEMMSFLATQKDVRGVLYYTQRQDSHLNMGGYYYLHHDIPFYDAPVWDKIRRMRPAVAPEELVSHIITDAPRDAGVTGVFEPLLHRGSMTVWRRMDNDQRVIDWGAHEHVIRIVTVPLHDLVRKTIGRLRASPLRFFVADDLYRDAPPPLIKLMIEPAGE